MSAFSFGSSTNATNAAAYSPYVGLQAQTKDRGTVGGAQVEANN